MPILVFTHYQTLIDPKILRNQQLTRAVTHCLIIALLSLSHKHTHTHACMHTDWCLCVKVVLVKWCALESLFFIIWSEIYDYIRLTTFHLGNLGQNNTKFWLWLSDYLFILCWFNAMIVNKLALNQRIPLANRD